MHEYQSKGREQNQARVIPAPQESTRATQGTRSGLLAYAPPLLRLAQEPDSGPSTPGAAPSAMHEAARAGVHTSAGPLPYHDIIQRAFGHHDIGGVQAHLGPTAAQSARATGAVAFATGEHVVFAGTPDLHTTAHEAAHVVQQRGGVDLPGGISRAGDPYERHADSAAQRVLAGESAQTLLDQFAGTQSAANPGLAPIQRKPTWTNSHADLVTATELDHRGQKYTLGHSFDSLAERERLLRPEYNIRSQSKTELKTGASNNAIPEIRILVANGVGKAAQVAARIASADLQKVLVFRSTGDQGLRLKNENEEEVVRSTETKPSAYATGLPTQAETFAPVGSYSFYDATRANSKSGHVGRHASYEVYKEDHDTHYKDNVMQVGGKAGEHFHHSEQAVYKMLYEQPEIVYNALQQAESQLEKELGAGGDLHVLAISVDIFTTRSACQKCGGSADQLLGDHFFRFAYEYLQKQNTRGATGGTYQIAPDYRTFVRFDSDYQHESSPGTSSERAEANKGATANILHAPSRGNAPVRPPSERGDSSGNSPVIYVSVPVKVAWDKAPIGRGDDEAPAYVQAVNAMPHLNLENLSGIVAELKNLSPDEKDLFVVRAYLRIQKGDSGRKNATADESSFRFSKDDLFSFLSKRITGEAFPRFIFRYYWEFADDLAGAQRRLVRYMQHVHLVDKKALEKHIAPVVDKVKDEVNHQIAKNLATDDPFDQKDAQMLGYQFGISLADATAVKQANSLANHVFDVQKGHAKKDWEDPAPHMAVLERGLELVDKVPPELFVNWGLVAQVPMLHPDKNANVFPMVVMGAKLGMREALQYLQEN